MDECKETVFSRTHELTKVVSVYVRSEQAQARKFQNWWGSEIMTPLSPAKELLASNGFWAIDSHFFYM